MNFVALKMLTGDRAKYLGLIFTIAFCTFLLENQTSIFAGILKRTGSQIADVTDAEIWVMDRMAKLEQSPRPEEIPPAEARVREAEAALADALVQQKLIESVTDRRAIREEDLQRRRLAANAAAARLDEAKAALALLKAGSWGPDLKIAKADITTAEAQVKRLETDIERLTMRAPAAGEILQVNVRAGEYAQVGALAKPRISWPRARAAVAINLVALYKALGGGW